MPADPPKRDCLQQSVLRTPKFSKILYPLQIDSIEMQGSSSKFIKSPASGSSDLIYNN